MIAATNLGFLSQWPWPLGLLVAGLLAAAAWWLYRRESRVLGQHYSWLLPMLRSAAIFLLVVTFLEPSIHRRYREGQPGRVTILIDDSQSMAVTGDRLSSTDTGTSDIQAASVLPSKLSRYERGVEALLAVDQQLLERLAEEFEVSVVRGAGDEVKSLWQATVDNVPPVPVNRETWVPQDWAASTGFGSAIKTATGQLNQNNQTTEAKSSGSQNRSENSIVVLMTDGQNNAGEVPLEVASQVSQSAILYTIGFGENEEPIDLAIRSVQNPERVFRSDTLNGKMQISDQLNKGTPLTARIQWNGKTVWEKQLKSEGGLREIDFSFPLEKVYDEAVAQLGQHVNYAVLPMRFECSISSGLTEINPDNNRQPMHVSIAAQKSRLLLLDERSRWETRYLKNMFSRDPAWSIDALLANDGEQEFSFPKSREELFKYDLVILGDLPSELLTTEQIVWLREFVELSGGGMVVISGARRHVAQAEYAELHKLLPVRWPDSKPIMIDDASQRQAKRVRLTSEGKTISALQIDATSTEASDLLWDELPTLQFVDVVESLPGSETLANGQAASGNFPFLVTRRYGAGRVLFCASDETWRWRYKLADQVHQRFWNQLSRWVMRMPMSVQGEFVSLDSGAASYTLGESVTINAQLRDTSRRPASGRSVTAVVSDGTNVVARVPLEEDPHISGFYSAVLRDLGSGEYRVSIEAAGFNRDGLDVHTNFSVMEGDNIEMQQIACNETLLKQMAAQTGGEYLPETEFSQLFEKLRPLSRGRFVESDTLLWQTYWWFTAAMVMLAIEWWLRKRAGLI